MLNRHDKHALSPGGLGAWLIYGLCLGVFIVSAWQSGVLSPAQRDSMAQVALAAQQTGIAMRVLCKSAEVYWNQYSDVAQHDYFGRGSKAGCGGAYEHWIRHGRQEGRVWRGNMP